MLKLVKENVPYILIFNSSIFSFGPGNSVGIAIGYGLDGPGIEFRWGGRDIPHMSRPALCPNSPL